MVTERLKKLREKMLQRNIDAYIIPTSDPHQSEYVADYYKDREFISGFTGSAGTVVVTHKEAGLWTDGRYFIQAEKELQGSGIKLYKMGMPGTPSIYDFINEKVSQFGKIGLNGLTYSYKNYLELRKNIGDKLVITDTDYIGEIWENRPGIPDSKAFVLEDKYAGKSVINKLKELRKAMMSQGIDYHFIGALDDICYLYNIRGRDVQYNPVLLSYSIVSQDEAFLFISNDKLDDEVKKHLADNGVKVRGYNEVFNYLKSIKPRKYVYFDPEMTNLDIVNSVDANVRFIKGINLTTFMKAIKNKVEIENQKNAYIKDGVALVKFFNWLETGVPTGVVTEMYAASKLEDFRKEQELFMEPSFGTISAYSKNAALPHYTPSEKNPVILKNKGLYLVDSGGQYLDGTTDTTRTIALGELTEDEIKHYTLTLKSHIALMTAKFQRGTKSSELDIIARMPLWKEGLDFNHGTGHGVGFVLSCHEGPQRISKAQNDIDMEVGMITSDEPGIYVEGSHGIRIENIMVCVPWKENEFGEFLGFESLSVCPIDTKPVDKNLLEDWEVEWLNNYNQMCLEKLSPYLNEEERKYLEKITEVI